MFPKTAQPNESIGIISAALERTGKVHIKDYRFASSLFASADVFHVHWVDELVTSARWKSVGKLFLFFLYVSLCRIFGRPIVWTVHNIGAYEKRNPFLESVLWKVFLPQVKWAIHLCPASLSVIHRLTDNPPPASVIPHPHYRSTYGPSDRSSNTHAQRDNGPFVFASFGLIRPYKGFENLVKVFHAWDLPDVALHISGMPSASESEKLVQQMIATAATDTRVVLDLRRLTNQDVENLVLTSNVVVIPYNKLLNSGVAAMALSLGRPILGPATGCILDYYNKLGPSWVLLYEHALDLEQLKRARVAFRDSKKTALPDLSWMDPDRIALDILEVYRRVTHTR